MEECSIGISWNRITEILILPMKHLKDYLISLTNGGGILIHVLRQLVRILIRTFWDISLNNILMTVLRWVLTIPKRILQSISVVIVSYLSFLTRCNMLLAKWNKHLMRQGRYGHCLRIVATDISLML